MSDMSNQVAIIGVGLHPFGRFEKTAMEMGAEAIQFALTDAGVDWKDIQFGFGGSHEVSNPDAVTRLVGLRGITFPHVFNACATAASAIQQTADTIRLGKYDIGIAIGLDKHPRGAFTDDPAKLALPQWYAGSGPEDVDVPQLQDTDAGNEVIHMAETGLCADGEQEKLVADGATEIHGSIPVNTDGGLIANGEPIGASGLRQVHELVRQLRGEAGERQVPGKPRVGLAQVDGAPGTASATLLSL